MSRILDNTGKHIEDIMNRTECKRHHMPQGLPCWVVNLSTSVGYAPALCGNRIRSAGFIGEVTASSIRRKTPTKPTQVRTNA